jgi:hypothetical protein
LTHTKNNSIYNKILEIENRINNIASKRNDTESIKELIKQIKKLDDDIAENKDHIQKDFKKLILDNISKELAEIKIWSTKQRRPMYIKSNFWS